MKYFEIRKPVINQSLQLGLANYAKYALAGSRLSVTEPGKKTIGTW